MSHGRGNLLFPLCICRRVERRARECLYKEDRQLKEPVYPNLLEGHLENLIPFFIIQHFIHNKYKVFTATVKKAHRHRDAPSEPSPVTLDYMSWREGCFLKRRHIFTTLYFSFK